MFRLNRNDKCRCGSSKKYKKCCMIVDLNSIGDGSYFIRLTDNKNHYVHLDKEDDEKYEYIIKEGIAGACGWHKKEGDEFIKTSNANNLELVKVSELLKDESLN